MNQPTQFMKFNQDLAEKSGGSDFLQSGGAHICTIKTAKCIQSNQKGTHGIEFSVVTDDGAKASYLTAYYAKADNTPVPSGQSLINALMGFLSLPAISYTSQAIDGEQCSVVPEFAEKKVGLFLEKVLYTKNDGGEGYKFNIRCPFDAQTKQTFKEKAHNKPAEAIERMIAGYKNKDERSAPTMAQQQSAGNQPRQPTVGFDDDIVF